MTDIEIIIRAPTILILWETRGIGTTLVDRSYHNRSKVETHIDEYVTMITVVWEKATHQLRYRIVKYAP